MTTEPTPSEPLEQAEHARQFGQFSRNLLRLAQAVAADGKSALDGTDVAHVFTAAAITLLVARLGDAGAAEYLRALAAGIDAGAPRAQ